MAKTKRFVRSVETNLGLVGIYPTESKKFTCWFRVNRENVNTKLAGQPITEDGKKDIRRFPSVQEAEEFLLKIPKPVKINAKYLTEDATFKRKNHSQNIAIPDFLGFLI